MPVVQVVYVTDHNYIFITAVSIYSLMDNGNPHRDYHIHILIDDTVSLEDQKFIERIGDKFSNYHVEYHLIVKEVFGSFKRETTYVNKATLYRLMLPELLPEVDKCIYLDADTMIRADIAPLYDTDITGNYIAGVWDMGIDSLGYTLEELPNMETYVNAGVLLLNLSLMREDRLQEKLLAALPKNYYFNDQDILNIQCYGKIKLLPEKYNYFGYREEFNFHVVITHFLSWIGIRPWINLKAKKAKEWWGYAEFFKGSDWYEKTYQSALDWYHAGSLKYILSKCSMYEQIYIWGSAFEAMKLCRALQINGVEKIIGFVDNKTEKQGAKVCGKEILASSQLQANEHTLIINTAVNPNSARSIEEQVLKMGFGKEQIIRYEKHHAGFYTFLDPVYREEEMQEIFMWEYQTADSLDEMVK